MGEWHNLHDGWVLRAVGDTGAAPADVAAAVQSGVPATVPGCVHTDLLAAGLIPDPYADCNEAQLRWIGLTDWRYTTEFVWSADTYDLTDLVCDGLDTFATVEVNGVVVARTENMHRSYRFGVADLLRDGTNVIAVTFDSAVRRARERRDEFGDLPRPDAVVPEPFNFVRKMACNFGWDWGPELVTAGIWRPIRLHSWNVARLDTVRPLVSVVERPSPVGGGRSTRVGLVEIHVELSRDGSSGPVQVSAQLAGVDGKEVTVGAAETSVALTLTAPDPELWWPHGYGPQPLYDLSVQVRDGERELDRWSSQIGFRTVELDTATDDDGSSFTFVINGTPMFMRGANWIPDDCFPHRVDAARYRRRLEQARDGNVTMLRVWGGGLYESSDFYQSCDELGILVWQDFPFACAAYPEELLADEVEAEARENVARLMPHPSLVLWNGNNENIWGWFDWGWQDAVGERQWGLGYYLDLLPTITAAVDPTRPYWPGSPYSGTTEIHPNSDDHGCAHLWEVWNTDDYTGYRKRVPRFAAEFGFQGPPTWATLTRAVHDEPLTPDSPGLRNHQKADDGAAKLARGLTAHFREPRGMADWHFATALNQARAVTVGVEHLRSHRGRCMGTLVWQLNDCWPVVSWSSIDGDGRRKPMWYALRRAYADRLATVQPRDDGLAVVLVNDSTSAWSDTLEVTRHRFDGTELARWTEAVVVPPGGCMTYLIPGDVGAPWEPSSELLVAATGEGRATWFFRRDKELAYPSPSYRIVVDRADDEVLVRVTARTLLRDLALFVDRLDPAAEVDDMLITLLPGETHTFTVRGMREVTPDDMGAPPVLRAANDLAVATDVPGPRS